MPFTKIGSIWRRRTRGLLEPLSKTIERISLENYEETFNVKTEQVIKDSGIIDWVEEYEHLKNQLFDGQPGCPGSIDRRQRKRDKRIIGVGVSAMDTERKQQEKMMELLERRKACREILADQIDGNIEKSNNLFYLNSKVSRKLVIWSLDSSTNILFYRVPSIPNFYV